MPLSDAARDLYRGMWATGGSRFVARERLRLMNLLSLATVSTLSTYVIVISLASILLQSDLTPFGQTMMNLFNVSLSVAILAFGLIENLRNHLGNSEIMNRSAIQIEALYHRFRIGYHAETYNQASIEDMQKQYSAALHDCPLNHTKADYDRFRVQKAVDFGLAGILNAPRRFGIHLLYWTRALGLYVAGIVFPPLLAGAILFLFQSHLFLPRKF
jgi:hypothetical protein